MSELGPIVAEARERLVARARREGLETVGYRIVDSPLGPLIAEFFRAGVDGGIPAGEVADQVVAAIKADQFWILTHPEMRHGPVERMQRAATGTNPTLNLGS